MRSMIRTALVLALALSPFACSYRPARFAVDPPVMEVGDTEPIPRPRKLDPLKEVITPTLTCGAPSSRRWILRRPPTPAT